TRSYRICENSGSCMETRKLTDVLCCSFILKMRTPGCSWSFPDSVARWKLRAFTSRAACPTRGGIDSCGNPFRGLLEPEETQMRAAHGAWCSSVEAWRRVIGGRNSATNVRVHQPRSPGMVKR